MGTYELLKQTIDNNIKTNGRQEITGQVLNTVLLGMVDAIGSGATLAGVAVPLTNPGTPDANVCWLAGPGTYANFGGLTVPDMNIGLLYMSGGAWAVKTMAVGSDIYVTNGLLSLTAESDASAVVAAIGSWDAFYAAVQARKVIADWTGGDYGHLYFSLETDNSANNLAGATFMYGNLRRSIGIIYTAALPPAEGTYEVTVTDVALQPATDNNLQTTSKEITGAINEVKQTADSAQPKSDSTLQTDAKTVIGAINEVNAAEKAVSDALGYKGTVTPIDVPISQDGKYRITGGDTYSNPSYAIRSPFSIKKGQMIYGYKGGTGVAFSISKIDNNGKWLDFMLNTFNLTDIVWVAPCDMTIEISSEKSFFPNLRLATLDSFAALQENGFALGMRKIYESYGAVYNETTGYYELNGLTDLTDSDMLEIIKVGNVLRFSSSINDTDQIIINASSLKVRTLLPNQFIYYFSNRRYSIFNAFRESSKIEVIILGTQDYPLVSSGPSSTAFYNCSKLRELKYLKLGTLNTSIFGNCTALNKCFITTEGDISFSSSPLLSYESLNYLVTNAANTDAITVTVHPTTYSYLLGAEPTEEVGGTTEEWQALVTTAQSKQISFATA